MAGNIKGITVEIGGNTAPLQNALKDVNKTSRDLQSELREVNKQLKLDPTNTTLLTQKQKLLAESITNTKIKLDTLKEAEKQVQEQFKRGEVSEEQYRALQREVIKTEQYLKSLEKQVGKSNVALEKISITAKKVGDTAGTVSNKMMPVTVAITAAGAAAIKMGSDYEESLNKVDVAFKDNTKEVEAWSKTTLDKFGIAGGTALDMAALFGDMATSMGLATDKAADMSMSLVGLAGDLASFKNIGIDQAQEALKGIFTGESEALKTLGIVMTDTTLKEYALSQGIKKKYEEMTQSEKVQLRYNYVMEMTKNAQGDFQRTSDGTANSTRVLGESIKELSTTFGQQLLPLITPIIQKTTELIKQFSQLDEGAKKIILIILGLVAAIAPVAKLIQGISLAIGGVTAVISTISGAIGLLTGTLTVATPAATALAGAISFMTGPIGIAIAAIAGIGLAGYGLYKHFSQSAIPAVKLFGDETSESTKKAVGAYMDLDKKAGQSLMNLKLTGQTVSKETADTLIQTFNDMGLKIKEGLDKHFNESYSVMQNFFAKSSTLSANEEAKILADMQSKNDAKKKETDNYTKQIQDILTKASNEKRALTSEEQQKINEIQEKMKVNAVKSLSDTELESKAILERMKQQSDELTAQQAVEVVKNSLEQKNKAVDNANKQYDETVKAIIKMRDETGSISKEQADKLIGEAKRQKDEAIKNATETHNKVVGEAKKQAGEHVNQVDWETGQVKTKWQEMKDNISQKTNDIVSNTRKGWDNIKTDVANKVQEMKNSIVNKYDEIRTSVSNKIQEIKDTASVKWNELLSKPREVINNIENSFTNLKLSIPSIGTSALSSLQTSVSGTISRIRSRFEGLSLRLPSISIPHIKLPHFSIRGSFSLVPPRVPTIGVNWYGTGGIFDRPSIIGVGEAGTEAVLPIDRLDELMARAIEKVGGNGTTQIIFQGNYTFANENDIDYFMNKAAQLVQRRKG